MLSSFESTARCEQRKRLKRKSRQADAALPLPAAKRVLVDACWRHAQHDGVDSCLRHDAAVSKTATRLREAAARRRSYKQQLAECIRQKVQQLQPASLCGGGTPNAAQRLAALRARVLAKSAGAAQ